MSGSLVTRLPAAVKLGVPLAAALLAAAACGSSSSSSAASSNGGGTPAAGASSAAGSGSAMTIETHTGSAGTFLTDGSGRSVYMFAKDGMNASACDGACASAWPPVTTAGSPAASGGAKSSDLGTLTRSNGTKQVTYNGHALYYFAGDSSAGQTNGQGVNGFGAKWWLVAPSGAIITGTAAGTAPGSSPTASKAAWS